MLLIGKPSISRAIYTMAMLNNQMVLFLVQINFLAAEIPVDIAPRNPREFLGASRSCFFSGQDFQ